MTPGELQAATERQHRWKQYGDVANNRNPYWRADDGGGWIDVDQYADDKRALADAYLAEHRPDDGERVTAEWLINSGWSQNLASDEFKNGLLVVLYRHWDVNGKEEWSAEVGVCGSIWPGEIITRGHVRRLCAALGIKVNGEPT